MTLKGGQEEKFLFMNGDGGNNGNKYITYRSFLGYAEKLSTLAGQIDVLSANITSLTERVHALEQQIAQFSDDFDLTLVNARYEGLQKHIQDLSDKLDSEIGKLNEKIEDLGKQQAGTLKWVLTALIPLIISWAFILYRIFH